MPSTTEAAVEVCEEPNAQAAIEDRAPLVAFRMLARSLSCLLDLY